MMCLRYDDVGGSRFRSLGWVNCGVLGKYIYLEKDTLDEVF